MYFLNMKPNLDEIFICLNMYQIFFMYEIMKMF